MYARIEAAARSPRAQIRHKIPKVILSKTSLDVDVDIGYLPSTFVEMSVLPEFGAWKGKESLMISYLACTKRIR